jgi:hypothetical protein
MRSVVRYGAVQGLSVGKGVDRWDPGLACRSRSRPSSSSVSFRSILSLASTACTAGRQEQQEEVEEDYED